MSLTIHRPPRLDGHHLPTPGWVGKPVYFRVYTWDHDKDDWSCFAPRVRRWRVRDTLRKLYGRSYDNMSILVTRIEEP